MQNIFTRAKAAHQAQTTSAAQQLEAERRERTQQREARRFMALHMTSDYVANLLGFGPATEKILVAFESGGSTTVMESNFSWEGGDWSVSFAPEVFDLDDFGRDEVLAGRRAGLVLYFLAPDGWFHVKDLATLGERLSRPDCAAIKSEARDE